MYVPPLTIDSVTMEQQVLDKSVEKVTRSKARHLRRKRLIAARKANDSSQQSESFETGKNLSDSEKSVTLSKSKARRLRRRRKVQGLNQKNGTSELCSLEHLDSNRDTNYSNDNETENDNGSSSSENLLPGDASSKETDPASFGANENYDGHSLASEQLIENCRNPQRVEINVDIILPTNLQRCSDRTSSSVNLTQKCAAESSRKLSSTELLENEKNLNNSNNLNFDLIDTSSSLYSCLDPNHGSNLTEIQEQSILKDSTIGTTQRYIWNVPNTSNENRSSSSTRTSIENNKNHKNSVELFVKDHNNVGSCGVTQIKSTVEELSSDSTVVGIMNSEAKSREQIKAEREAKKAAKAATKGKAKTPKGDAKLEQTPSQESKSINKSLEKVEKSSNEEKKIVKEDPEVPAQVLRLSDNVHVENEASGGKSKAELRAERRAKQEAQRAAKEKQILAKNKGSVDVSKSVEVSKTEMKATWEIKPIDKIVVSKKVLVESNPHEVKHFKHLYHEREQSLVYAPTLNSKVHPAIVRLGVQYANKVIVGSNARCVAMLAAINQLVRDFERPPQADFTRSLEACLQECAAYLQHCRPMAVSMQNALRHLKWQMTQLPTTISDHVAKSKLEYAINTYIREQVELAGRAISNTIQTKISNGDVILTYAFSSLIHNILIDAYDAGTKFRVIIVDGRPWLEGKEQLRRLVKHGIQCSYILINALSFIMPEVTKVFLGAHAILANGAVMSRAGTAQVALMAKAFNVPVLVACETHKSCERVQTDSFVYNEIGDANELASHSINKSKKSPIANWKTKKCLDLLNIIYDVTPADLVTAVVTELAILPCTSVPVILRIKPSEI